MPDIQDTDKKMVRLADLRPGQQAMIRVHGEHAAGLMLMEMGCIPGASVRLEMIAPLGDPLAIRVAGYCLGVRKADAEHIWVTPEA